MREILMAVIRTLRALLPKCDEFERDYISRAVELLEEVVEGVAV